MLDTIRPSVYICIQEHTSKVNPRCEGLSAVRTLGCRSGHMGLPEAHGKGLGSSCTTDRRCALALHRSSQQMCESTDRLRDPRFRQDGITGQRRRQETEEDCREASDATGAAVGSMGNAGPLSWGAWTCNNLRWKRVRERRRHETKDQGHRPAGGRHRCFGAWRGGVWELVEFGFERSSRVEQLVQCVEQLGCGNWIGSQGSTETGDGRLENVAHLLLR